MCDKNFTNILSENFNSIKNNFQIGLAKLGYEFDEDLFVDICIKCSITLYNRNLTEQETIKYMWVAYMNSHRRIKAKQIYTSSLDCILKTEDEGEGICDDIYNPYKYQLCDFIIESVKTKFGENVTNAWKSHICENKTYKELFQEYGDLKFNFEFKRIKKYILNNLAKRNNKFIELVAELRD